MSTQAEKIAALLGDDGTVFRVGQLTLDGLCKGIGGVLEIECERERWTLPDGSVITVIGNAWDLGYPDCWCWQGAGHHEDCRNQAELDVTHGHSGHRETTAQDISAMFSDCGAIFTNEHGVRIVDVCEELAVKSVSSFDDADNALTYIFPDDSAITFACGAWDLGYKDCFCWQSNGHDAHCVARSS